MDPGRPLTASLSVPVAAVLVVEGCGSSPRSLDACTTLRLWVEAPTGLRLARGLARDGAELEPEWRRWLVTEAAEFAREDTRARADLHVDGTSPVDGSLRLLRVDRARCLIPPTHARYTGAAPWGGDRDRP